MDITRRFEGYAVLITGAGRGIGAATARRFTDEGARVLVTDLDGGRAEKTAAALPGALPFTCDVTDRSAVEAAVAYAVGEFGALDVLVNNAYACSPDAPLFEDEDDESWHRDLDATLSGAFRVSRAAMPHLAAAGGRGAIVSVGSVNGAQDFGNHAYSAAKAGLTSLTRTLAATRRRAGSGSTWWRRARSTRTYGRRAGWRRTSNRPRHSTRWAGSAYRRTSRRRSRSWRRGTPRGSPG